MAVLSAMTTWLQGLYNKLLPTPCLLCGMDAIDMSLCLGCIDSLPRLSSACERCAMPITSGKICGACLKKPPVQDKTFSVFTYEHNVKRCISLFKYHHKLGIGDLFAQQMLHHLTQRDSLPDCIIPVPLHPNRLRYRGFNQALEIAKVLSRELNIPLDYHQLIRTKNTTSQSELGFKERRKNILNAFSYLADSAPKHIALIDDVMTTGATTQEAGRILKKYGAETIEVWTVARATAQH